VRRLFGVLLLAPLGAFLFEAAAHGLETAPPWGAWGNTLVLAGTATALSLALGLPAAFALAHAKSAWPVVLVSIPLVVPPVLAASLWLGLRLPWPGPAGCGAILAATHWPVVALLGWAALSRVPAAELDAAAVHGVSVLRPVQRRIRGSVGAAALLVFLLAAAEFSVPSTFTVPTLGYVVFERLSAFDSGSAAAAAAPLAALAIATGIGLSRAPLLPQAGVPRPFLTGRALLGARLLAATAVLLTVLLPLAVFALTAGSPFRAARVHADGLLWSFGTAGVSATGLVLWSLSRGGRDPLEAGWLASLALPGIVTALGALVLANRLGVQAPLVGSGALLVFCLMARAAWVAWAPLRDPVERGQLEAAELAGLSRFATWRRIVLPALWPRALAAGAIVAALSIAEVGPAVLASPPGGQPAALHLLNLIHYGYNDTVAALSLLLFAAAAILAGVGIHVGRLHRVPVGR
jgi:ABC-type Fe3+ transport system permease subunit